MEQFRLVDTPHGPIPVLLRRRRVKNLNLRVGADGTVALSVPLRYPLDRAEDFLRDKSGWIARALERQRAGQASPLPPVGREECAARFRFCGELLDRFGLPVLDREMQAAALDYYDQVIAPLS